MAKVEFYQTSLSETDRCYDSNSYNTYLSSSKNKYTLDVIDAPNIIPNIPFYINLSSTTDIIENVLKCNYILFTYTSVKYGSFIDTIEPLAFEGKFRITHHTDIWYMAQTLYKDTLDFHGQCIRAHVNEAVSSTEKSKFSVNFRNTYNTPEETFSTKDLDVKQSYIISDENDPNIQGYEWIYLYINNPQAIQTVYSGQQQAFKLSSLIQYIIPPNKPLKTQKTLQGFLLCGVLNLESGRCYFRANTDNSKNYNASERDYILISDLTSEYITVMFTSKISPNKYFTVGSDIIIVNGSHITIYYPEITNIPPNSNYGCKELDFGFMETNKNLCSDLACYISIIELTLENNIINNTLTYNINNVKNIDIVDYVTCSYYNYINKYIFKAFTSAYNPAYIGNTLVECTEIKGLSITLSPEGSYFWVTPEIEKQGFVIDTDSNEYLYSQTITLNNYHQFAPDTVLDYWTEINAKRSIISSEQQKFGSVVQGVFGTVGGIVDITSSATSTIGKKQSNANYVAGVAGGVVGGVENIVSSIGNAVYSYQQADISQKIAEQQYRAGIGTKDITTGYYGSMLDRNSPSILWYKQNHNSFENIAIRLHRYGYNTFLQIDDIYKNHKRRHFNYIKCPNIEVHGVPLSVGNEIAKMFQNGVHLWNCIEEGDKVGDFEVNNHEMAVEEM